MTKPSNKKNVIVVSHKAVTQPDDDLVYFFNQKKYANVLHITHSFSSAQDRRSYCLWYKNGRLYKKMRSADFINLPEIFIHFKEFAATIYWIIQAKLIWDIYIAMDGLCVFFGNFLRSFRRVKKTIFWAVDFVPENRFNSVIKNQIYHWINIHGYKNSDEMWDFGPKMAQARHKFLKIKKTDYRSHKIVPYGVWVNRIKTVPYEKCEKKTIVFMGHISRTHGVQTIIKVIPDLAKIIPDIKFKIIGGGQYLEDLIKLAEKLNVKKYCDFKGKIPDIRCLEKEVAKSCLAVAPYIKEKNSYTYYTDLGKIKTYLACGVPVLMTDVPWNAKEIENNQCGLIIKENKNDIIKKILYLIDGKNNVRFRKNAIQFSRSFDYNNIFTGLNF